MLSRRILSFAIAASLVTFAASPAEAQLGRLGGAIKKKAGDKAAEAVGIKEKEEEKPAASAGGSNAGGSARRPSTSRNMAITNALVDSFVVGLNAEVEHRDKVLKRRKCVEQVRMSQEAMDIIASMSARIDALGTSTKSDAQKMADMANIGADMERKQKELEVARCGPDLEADETVNAEGIGAGVAGMTQYQYSLLKERLTPFCAALARGRDTPANAKYVYTDDEKAVMKVRCTALLPSLNKTL